MKVNLDMTYCSGVGCPLKDNCWRHIDGLGQDVVWQTEPLWDGKTCQLYKGN